MTQNAQKIYPGNFWLTEKNSVGFQHASKVRTLHYVNWIPVLDLKTWMMPARGRWGARVINESKDCSDWIYYFEYDYFSVFVLCVEACAHWWLLLWFGHQSTPGRVSAGHRSRSLHRDSGPHDFGHLLRLQRLLRGFCWHQERTSEKGKSFFFFGFCAALRGHLWSLCHWYIKGPGCPLACGTQTFWNGPISLQMDGSRRQRALNILCLQSKSQKEVMAMASSLWLPAPC